jgi:plastocyanin
MIRTWLTLALAGCTAACTPGAASMPAAGGPPATVTIDVSLTAHAAIPTAFGALGGYAPAVTTVAVGSTLRFVNSDGFAHTATAVSAAAFPVGSPFTASAQTQSGTALSQGWSSGTLAAGASSQVIAVDRAGTYLYGCFFHYGSPMRGVIVAH